MQHTIVVAVVASLAGALMSAEPAHAFSLAEALERAKSADPRRALVDVDVDAAGHRAHQSTAELLPSIDLGATLTRNAREIKVNDRIVNPLLQPQSTLQGRVRLFRGATIPDAIAGWTSHSAQQADARALTLDLEHEVAARFLDVVESRSLVERQAALVAWAEELARVAKVRADAESGLQLDVELAVAELARARAAKSRADGELAIANAALVARIGKDIDDARCDDACIKAPPSDEVDLQKKRAAYNARVLDEDAANIRALGGWFLFLPNLEVVANGRLSLPTLFNPDPFWWNAQLVASWNLFAGTGDVARALSRGTEQRRARLNLELTKRAHREELARAEAQLTSARLTHAAEEKRRTAQSNAVQLAEARFKAGLESLLDVQSAARERAVAEQALVRARFDLERARLAVWRARGEGPKGPNDE